VDIWFWVVVVVAAAIVAFVIVGLRSARSRVDPTQVSIDAALAGQVRDRYAAGDKVGAVKILRAATGLGLADAVRIADKLGATAKPAAKKGLSLDKGVAAPTSGLGPDNEAEVRALVAGGNKIEAIKLVRTVTGMGLKDAKDFVDRL
jgi:large subunit ribosomal protein L7/L12